MKIWSCKIGECVDSALERDGKYWGADAPMREAIRRAYLEVTGQEPNFIFSGWGAKLTPVERGIVSPPKV